MNQPTMSGTTGPRRPRSQAKRERILEAARAVLLGQGYQAASMDAIAEQAGVSKATVYGHFGRKEDLFAAVIERRVESLRPVLDRLNQPTEDMRADLTAFASLFQRVILVGESFRWNLLVMAEAERHPQIARRMFQHGPATVLAAVETYCAAQAQAGRLVVDDPLAAAEHFMGLVIGMEMVRVLLASQPQRTQAEIEARAERAVTAFLRAYGTAERGEGE